MVLFLKKKNAYTFGVFENTESIWTIFLKKKKDLETTRHQIENVLQNLRLSELSDLSELSASELAQLETRISHFLNGFFFSKKIVHIPSVFLKTPKVSAFFFFWETYRCETGR